VTILAEAGVASTEFAAPQHAEICTRLALDLSRYERQLRGDVRKTPPPLARERSRSSDD